MSFRIFSLRGYVEVAFMDGIETAMDWVTDEKYLAFLDG